MNDMSICRHGNDLNSCVACNPPAEPPYEVGAATKSPDHIVWKAHFALKMALCYIDPDHKAYKDVTEAKAFLECLKGSSV